MKDVEIKAGLRILKHRCFRMADELYKIECEIPNMPDEYKAELVKKLNEKYTLYLESLLK